MKNMITKSTAAKPFNAWFLALIYLLAAGLITSLITGCSPAQDEQSYIEFSNPASAFKYKGMARLANTNPIDSLVIRVTDTQDREISSVEVFDQADTIKLNVPGNISLIISATAAANDATAYFGETTIDPIRPGDVSRFSLMLLDQNKTLTPIAIDVPINSAPVSGKSQGLSFSKDDSFILFFSDVGNLAPNDNNDATDLFLRNISDETIKNLHSDSEGTIVNAGDVTEADISADGVYVVFTSSATNLTPDSDSDATDIFLKNTITGEIQRLSKNGASGLNSYNPQISDDGNTVIFYSQAALNNGASNALYVYSRLTNTLSPLPVDDISDNYKLSGDGRVLVYQANADNNGGLKIANLSASASEKLSRSNTTGLSTFIHHANINFSFNVSQDGNFTLFIPEENISGLTKDQIYLYNRTSKRTSLVSKTRTNETFSGALTQNNLPALSNDSRYVVFSYDNIVYVRSLEFGNLLELNPGSTPFISNKGDKIGYELNGRLFLIDNPLYIDNTAAPNEKADVPSNFSINVNGATATLSWDDNGPDTSYYRIYQDSQPDIASKPGNPKFLPIIYETVNTSYNIDLTPNSNGSSIFYFIVIAVNKNGEGRPSIENTAVLYSNEGSEPAPKIIEPDYQGMVAKGKSYYLLDLPALGEGTSNPTYAVYLKNVRPGVILTSTEEGVICENDSKICTFPYIETGLAINLVVDGSATANGSNFDVIVSPVEIVDITLLDSPLVLTLPGTANTSTLLLLNNLQPDSRYIGEDITDDSRLDTGKYSVYSYLESSPNCDVLIGETDALCDFRTTGSGSILLGFEVVNPLSQNERTLSLDIIKSPLTGEAAIEIIDEKYAQFSNLTPGGNYYLSILSTLATESLEESTFYSVFREIDLNKSICTGTVNPIINDLDSCVFIAPGNGEVFISLEPMMPSGWLPQTAVNIALSPLDQTEILQLSDEVPDFTPTKRLMFAKYNGLTGNEWYNLEMEILNDPLYSLFNTLVVYDDLLSGPQCRSDLLFEMTSCELKNNLNNLIVFEFTDAVIDSLYPVTLGAYPIVTEPADGISQQAISPPAYFHQANDLSSGSDILTKATISLSSSPITNLALPISPQARMSVYNDYWRTKACTSVPIGSNLLLCVTDAAGNNNVFNVKIYDYLSLGPSYSELVATVVSTAESYPLLTLNTASTSSTSDDYQIYKFEGLVEDAEYWISVRDTSNTSTLQTPIPFYVVPSQGDKRVCEPDTNSSYLSRSDCSISMLGSGFIIIDTSRLIAPVSFTVEINDLSVR